MYSGSIILTANGILDSRAEYIQPNSTGIRETVEKANEIFKSVKQTSDATIDSRLLVAAADLSFKQTAQAVLGNLATGIDVDEFVSKCISFMRRDEGGSSSQRLSRRVSGRATQADDSDDEDEAFNWDYLGRQACFPNNLRPSVSGFLLGPLSVQKRSRQQTQRRARERIDPSQLVRPQELQKEDLDTQETADLTSLCTNIRNILVETQTRTEEIVNQKLMRTPGLSEQDMYDFMNRHDISSDGGVPLFRFCINPRSFGQTVENLFYLSFLVRDGSVGVSTDTHGLPTLRMFLRCYKFPKYQSYADHISTVPSEPADPSEAQRQGLEKHQAVFSLDYDTWEDIIKTFGIKESLIPHRNERPASQGNTATATTWQS